MDLRLARLWLGWVGPYGPHYRNVKSVAHTRSAATRSFPATDLGLKQIAGPTDDFAVDLIAVHGLGANPHKTWTWRPPSTQFTEQEWENEEQASNVQVNWLQTLLPSVLPTVRINTFNYVSDWKADAPHESIRNISLKLLSNIDATTTGDPNKNPPIPIIFIGHSFGGLVIEKALVLAAQTEKYRHILHRTYSTVLLGTPHRGTKAANLGVTLGYCAAALGLGADTSLLETLKKDSTYIKDLVTDFSILAREKDIDVVCFYELYDTQIVLKKSLRWAFSTLVVDQDSGTIPGWRAIGLHADHSGLNKFRSVEDVNFQLVSAKLQDRANKALEKISQRQIKKAETPTVSRELFFIVPHVRNPLFTPRPAVSNKIAVIQNKDGSNDTDQVRFALFGLGGSGTTQRALDLAYSSRSYKHVFWVNGNSILSFEHTMSTIADSVFEISVQQFGQSHHDILLATKDWLESKASGDWLLIVDGVNDPTMEFLRYTGRYLPTQRGTVLFTSCTARIANFVGSPRNTIELGPMSILEGSELFKKVSGLKHIERREITELLERLEFLPLAISQAASYIQVRQMSVHSYLQILRNASDQSRTIIMDSAAARYGDTDYIPQSIMTTWNLALDQIQQENPRAIDLLRFLSLLGPNVPIRTLRSNVMAVLKLDEDIAFHDAMGLLASYRLVIPSHSNNFDESTYRLHRLVALRTRVSMGSERATMTKLALKAIEKLFPYPQPRKDHINKECSGMLQHAESVLMRSADRPDLAELRNSLKYKLDLYRLYSNSQESTPDMFTQDADHALWSHTGGSPNLAKPRLLNAGAELTEDIKGLKHADDAEKQNADLKWIEEWRIT